MGQPEGLLTALLVYPGLTLGHGSYQQPFSWSADNESSAPLVRLLSPWLEGSPGYKLIGLAFTGLALSLPLLVLVIWGAPPWIALLGLAKPACYALGSVLPAAAPWLQRGPELGEFLFGAAFCGSLPLL